MLAESSQLAQSRPSDTNALGVFTADIITEVTLIIVCNTTGSARAFSVYHDDDGTTFDDNTALYRSQSIPANTTFRIELANDGAGVSVGPGGNLAVQSDLADALTFSVYGKTLNTTGGSYG